MSLNFSNLSYEQKIKSYIFVCEANLLRFIDTVALKNQLVIL